MCSEASNQTCNDSLKERISSFVEMIQVYTDKTDAAPKLDVIVSILLRILLVNFTGQLGRYLIHDVFNPVGVAFGSTSQSDIDTDEMEL